MPYLRLTEQGNIARAFVPFDCSSGTTGSSAAANYVSLANYGHVACVFTHAAGTSSGVPVITILQATDGNGTGAKALNFTRIDVKSSSTEGFTKVTQAANNSYTVTNANVQGEYVIEFDAEELDCDGGFNNVQMSVGDVGTSALICAGHYILTDPRFSKQFPVSPSSS